MFYFYMQDHKGRISFIRRLVKSAESWKYCENYTITEHELTESACKSVNRALHPGMYSLPYLDWTAKRRNLDLSWNAQNFFEII